MDPCYVEMPQEKKYYCEYCPLNFTMFIYAVQHMKNFHQVDVSDDETAQKRLEEPPAVIEPWNMIDISTFCDVCNKTFTTNWSMIEHKTSVHDGIRYPCAHCEHIASSKRNLRGHINRKHPEKKLPAIYNTIKLTDEEMTQYQLNCRSRVDKRESGFPCDKCDLISISGNALKLHHTRKHSSNHLNNYHKEDKSEGSFSCDKCDFVSISETALKIHHSRKHSVAKIDPSIVIRKVE